MENQCVATPCDPYHVNLCMLSYIIVTVVMLGLQYLFTFGNVGYWTLKSPTVVAVTRITFTLSWLMDFSLFLIPLFYKLFLEFAIIFYSCLQFSTSFGEQSTTPEPTSVAQSLVSMNQVLLSVALTVLSSQIIHPCVL